MVDAELVRKMSDKEFYVLWEAAQHKADMLLDELRIAGSNLQMVGRVLAELDANGIHDDHVLGRYLALSELCDKLGLRWTAAKEEEVALVTVRWD